MKHANITLTMEALQKYADVRFDYIKEHLTDGNMCYSLELDRPVKLDGLGLLMSGEVVAFIGRRFSLTRVYVAGSVKEYNGRCYDAMLEMGTCGGRVMYDGNWETAIAEYNSSITQLGSSLIAYTTL